MLSLKNSLVILKKTDALLEGHFVLSSGLHSTTYIQCAKLLSHPNQAHKICLSLSKKIKNIYKKIDIILSPAMGGIIIGYEIGRLLKKETIFCERVNGNFKLRRGFRIKKNSKVLLINDQNLSVSVKSFNKDFYAIMKGSTDGKYLISSFIKDNNRPLIGDILVTSGNVGVFPKNLLVGKVIGIAEEKIIAIPFVDVKNIEFVQIIKNN